MRTPAMSRDHSGLRLHQFDYLALDTTEQLPGGLQ